MPRRMPSVLVVVLLGLVLTGAVVARVWHLGSLPGINGDEAWYGVQAMRFLNGQPVSWFTPSGLPVNPFFTGLELPFLLIFEPRFWILRAPALISGLLAVLLADVLGRRAVGRTSARIAALILAVLPIAIGYSRFGWDASQTPLFGVLAVTAALSGHTWGMALAFGAGLLVHPTNAFLFPALLLPWGVRIWPRMAGRPRHAPLVDFRRGPGGRDHAGPARPAGRRPEPRRRDSAAWSREPWSFRRAVRPALFGCHALHVHRRRSI